MFSSLSSIASKHCSGFNSPILFSDVFVLRKTTDQLNCYIGVESNLYAASCALTSRLCKNVDPRRLNFSVISSVLDSFPTCLSSSYMKQCTLHMYRHQLQIGCPYLLARLSLHEYCMDLLYIQKAFFLKQSLYLVSIGEELPGSFPMKYFQG